MSTSSRAGVGLGELTARSENDLMLGRALRIALSFREPPWVLSSEVQSHSQRTVSRAVNAERSSEAGRVARWRQRSTRDARELERIVRSNVELPSFAT